MAKLKTYSTDKTKTPEQIKKDLTDARMNRNPAAKVPGTKSGRPLGIHTKHKEGSRAGLPRTDEQWAKVWDAFFANLESTCKVVQSCELAGTSYQEMTRRRKVDPEFEERFQKAYEQGIQNLEDEAVRRAFQGVKRPVFYKGEEVATVEEHSDQLLIFLLKGNRPDKFKERTQNENTNFNVDLAERLEQAKKRGAK